jgi:sarcosine oxidase subunit alpha
MITFTFNGQELFGVEGQSVAAALIANEKRITRRTRHEEKARGIFCGIGVCYDCLITIDGQKNLRSCITALRQGMVVEVQ